MVDSITRRVWTARGKFREAVGRLVPYKAGVQLFNSKRYWWLHYSKTRLTGHFKSKKKAIDWYESGGR